MIKNSAEIRQILMKSFNGCYFVIRSGQTVLIETSVPIWVRTRNGLLLELVMSTEINLAKVKPSIWWCSQCRRRIRASSCHPVITRRRMSNNRKSPDVDLVISRSVWDYCPIILQKVMSILVMYHLLFSCLYNFT